MFETPFHHAKRSRAQYRIGALERALEIIAAIGDAEEISLGVLAGRLEIPKGSLVRHLRVLEAAGYVTMAPETKLYSLGPTLIHLGFVARQRLKIPELATPAMRWLRDRYDESVHLGILSGPDVIHVAVAPSSQLVKMAVPVGERTFVHVSALGKSLLAWASSARLTEIVDERGLPKLTSRTITTLPKLRTELQRTRERGWSMDDEESADGLRCVGAPVRSERGEVVAAISVSAPAARLSREKAGAVALVLSRVAEHVSSRLGWPGADGRPHWGGAAPWSTDDQSARITRATAHPRAARDGLMRITHVEAIVLRQPREMNVGIADGSQDALLIRIHTDDGIVGYGEADSLPSVVKAIIDAPRSHKYASGLGSLLIDQDPTKPGPLQRRLYEGSLYYGRRGAVVHAISGLEIALWDIFGKATGQPIHTLLGGAHRDKLRAYASTLMPDTPSEVRTTVTRQREAGFTAVKLGYGPLGQDPELDVSLVAAARDAAGYDCDVLIDIGLGWKSARTAIDCVRRMEEYRPYWIEEPFMPDEHGKYAALAAAVTTPIAAGEQEATVVDFRRLVDIGVEVLQPDVTRVGGMQECLRVAELARTSGRRCVLHAWSTGIIKAASLHVLAAMPDGELMEYCVQTTELNQRLVTEQFPVVDGYVAVPQGPGLGIEIDEDVLEACRVWPADRGEVRI